MVTLCLRLKIVKFYGEYQSCKEFYEMSSVCSSVVFAIWRLQVDCTLVVRIMYRADRVLQFIYKLFCYMKIERWGKSTKYWSDSWHHESFCFFGLLKIVICSVPDCCFALKNAFLFSMICWKHNQFLSTSCLQIVNEVQFRMGTIRFICTCYAMSFYFITVHEGLPVFVQILDSMQVHVTL